MFGENQKVASCQRLVTRAANIQATKHLHLSDGIQIFLFVKRSEEVLYKLSIILFTGAVISVIYIRIKYQDSLMATKIK